MHEVYRYVYRRCRDREMAADVTQDVFVAAVRSVPDPDDISVAWLIATARNRLIDLVRRDERYVTKLRLIRAGWAETGDDDDRVVTRLELEAAMARLSVLHRVVLTLHYLDGHSVPALAEQLGRSVKSVEGLMTRARRNLRRELGVTSLEEVDDG